MYVFKVKYFLLEYHDSKSILPFRYLNIIFSTCIWVSFGVDWNLVTNTTTYIIAGIEVGKYNKLPITYLYIVWFASWYSSSFLNIHHVTIWFLSGAQFSMPSFFRISFKYLVWEMNIPLSYWETWNPRKNDSSPSMVISKSFCISTTKFWHIWSTSLQKMISSTYTTMINKFSLSILI